jgi:hypothetical protein
MKLVLAVLLCGLMLAAKKAPIDSGGPKIKIFVADSESWRFSSFNTAGVGTKGGVAAGGATAGNNKFTVSVMAQLYKQCPTVQVVSKEENAEYAIRLDQDMGVLMFHQSMAVFNRAGEMIFASSEKSISKDVRKFCASPLFAAAKHP